MSGRELNDIITQITYKSFHKSKLLTHINEKEKKKIKEKNQFYYC
jgi:hypothetical protein